MSHRANPEPAYPQNGPTPSGPVRLGIIWILMAAVIIATALGTNGAWQG